ncbi:hypothetical protein [Winogradskyella sp.]|uniref:hypothetical protein n=1 Tax=Winogradskyella sp. TaxID=1883156 RepID=UPI002639F3E9|nr:hypothetical protein [Winogradskyella sp.]
MRNIFFILLLLVVAITSCDGRKTKSQALLEDIEEFKKEVTAEIPVYQPESYVEREVDTLLHNGYRVSIKTYSDMEESVLFTKIKDTINYHTYYRNFKFNIIIEKNGNRIFDEQFNKKRMNKLLEYNTTTLSELRGFDQLSVLKSIELNKNLPNSENIEIDIIYAIPNTDRISFHIMSINEKGIMNIERKYIN